MKEIVFGMALFMSMWSFAFSIEVWIEIYKGIEREPIKNGKYLAFFYLVTAALWAIFYQY